MLVSDTGGGATNILLEIAYQAMAEGKVVLYFTAMGDMNCAADLCGSAQQRGYADRLYLNSYLHESGPVSFHSVRARPDWDTVIKERGVVCTVLAALERAPDDLRDEAGQVLSDALRAVEAAGCEENVVILIDAIAYFGDDVRQSLTRIASKGADVVGTSVYSHVIKSGLDLAGSNNHVFLLLASSLRSTDSLPFVMQDISVSDLKNLDVGEGFELDRTTGKAFPVKFSLSLERRPTEVAFANAMLA